MKREGYIDTKAYIIIDAKQVSKNRPYLLLQLQSYMLIYVTR